MITKSEILKPCKPAHQFDQENISKSEAFKKPRAQESKGPGIQQAKKTAQNIQTPTCQIYKHKKPVTNLQGA